MIFYVGKPGPGRLRVMTDATGLPTYLHQWGAIRVAFGIEYMRWELIWARVSRGSSIRETSRPYRLLKERGIDDPNAYLYQRHVWVYEIAS